MSSFAKPRLTREGEKWMHSSSVLADHVPIYVILLIII